MAREKDQQSLINAIMLTEEKERKRFAKDLHDGLGPLLSSAKMYLKSLELLKDPAKQTNTINKVCEIIDEALHTIKEVAVDLNPHILKDFGLVSALKIQFNKLKANRNIQLHIDSDLRNKIDESLEINLYRIFTELLNNTIKHADAKNIYIKLILYHRTLRIIYSDDGKGYDVKKVAIESTGKGIYNIISRIESLNGSIGIQSKPGKGIKVKIKINN